MFGFHEDAHDQVYGGKTHHSSWTHEMIAGAAAFEAMKSYEGQAGGSSFSTFHSHSTLLIVTDRPFVNIIFLPS